MISITTLHQPRASATPHLASEAVRSIIARQVSTITTPFTYTKRLTKEPRRAKVHCRRSSVSASRYVRTLDNEWELLKEELVVKDEVEKARLFAADEAERERQSMTSSPEAVTTLDDIIEAARRKSVVYKPGNNAIKRKLHHNLLEPPRVRRICVFTRSCKFLQEDGGSSVQAILTDQHFATQLLDSDEEGGIVGDPPSTIDDDLDLEQLVQFSRSMSSQYKE
jgi:hypothetical protein